MFLRHSKIISYSYDDMLGLSIDFFIHRFPIKKGVKLLNKNPRYIHATKSFLVKKELDKYLQVGFIIPIDYFG